MLNENSVSGVAVVVGAGTMGGGIAADLANAGWDVHLLDVTEGRARAGWERVRDARPPLLFLPEWVERIRPGVLDDGPEPLARADWVVEAVAEDVAAKRGVFARVAAHVGPATLITSNTSGLSLAALSAHCPPDFRRRFFGTHFLNPPRYLKLLEVVPAPETDPVLLASFVRFAEPVLGHRVVVAKDTPGFISTRLWVTHLMDTVHTAVEQGVDVETADALTGPFLGRPRSATFRMADLVGLDIVAAVAKNQRDLLPHDPLRARLRLPDVMARLLDEGRLGEKTGAGFYKREGRDILALDLATGDYRPRRDVDPDPSDPAHRRFVDALLGSLFDYARQVRPEIADSDADVDRVMRWGFGWEKGPFQMASERRGGPPPVAAPDPEYITLAEQPVVLKADAATLYDLSGGVLCLAFHTKMNTFRPETCDLLLRSLARAEREGRGLLLANDGPHFSAGYDLARLVAHMQAGRWEAIDAEMRACQEAFTALKYGRVPVAAAPHGFTLGAGCECCLHCRVVHAAPELYMGLPEAAVGVIPCGGGVKETLIRRLEADPDPLAAARAALHRIAHNRNSNRNSTSAQEARSSGWLRPTDTIARNGDRRVFEARRLLTGTVYPPLSPAPVAVSGADGLRALRADIAGGRDSGDMSEHDARIADAVAVVLCGGEGAAAGDAPEQTLLDLERALFLDLCRHPLSQARMRHLLETGKPLKN